MDDAKDSFDQLTKTTRKKQKRYELTRLNLIHLFILRFSQSPFQLIAVAPVTCANISDASNSENLNWSKTATHLF